MSPGHQRRTDIKVGEIDPSFNVRVKCKVFFSDECIVDLDHDLDTYWDTDGDITPEMGLVLNRVAQLEAIPLNGLSKDVKLAFRTLVAEGVARALDDGNNKSA